MEDPTDTSAWEREQLPAPRNQSGDLSIADLFGIICMYAVSLNESCYLQDEAIADDETQRAA